MVTSLSRSSLVGAILAVSVLVAAPVSATDLDPDPGSNPDSNPDSNPGANPGANAVGEVDAARAATVFGTGINLSIDFDQDRKLTGVVLVIDGVSGNPEDDAEGDDPAGDTDQPVKWPTIRFRLDQFETVIEVTAGNGETLTRTELAREARAERADRGSETWDIDDWVDDDWLDGDWLDSARSSDSDDDGDWDPDDLDLKDWLDEEDWDDKLDGLDPKDVDPKDFDPKDFDPKDFDLSDFDLSDFDPSDFDPSDFDLNDFDLGDFDLGDFDPSDFDPDDFDLDGLNLDGFEDELKDRLSDPDKTSDEADD